MIKINQFEELLSKSESSILDFKRDMYDFNSSDGVSGFVKDVISFCNTKRNETSYIIIGVDDKDNNNKILKGILKNYDDWEFQDKVKNKVYPRPHFLYYNYLYKNLTYGILEFPVIKYTKPIAVAVNGKGLELGRIYHRVGTTNTEAIGNDTIGIYDWLQSLPDNTSDNDLSREIDDLIKRLSSKEELLSVVINDIRRISRIYKLSDLYKFSSGELSGFYGDDLQDNPDYFDYRKEVIRVSPDKFEPNGASEGVFKSWLDDQTDVKKVNFLFNQSIISIEETLKNLSEGVSMYGTFQMDSQKVFPHLDFKDIPIYLYVFKNDYTSLYRKIRQAAVKKLMAINQLSGLNTHS